MKNIAPLDINRDLTPSQDHNISQHWNSELRQEIRQIINENHQSAIAALASFAALVTLFATLQEKFPSVVASVTLLVPIPFLALWMTFIGKLWGISTIATFLRQNVEPKLNGVIGWETYLASSMPMLDRWSQQGLWALGQGLLLLLPIFLSLGGFLRISSQISPWKIWWIVLFIIDIGAIIGVGIWTTLAMIKSGFFGKFIANKLNLALKSTPESSEEKPRANLGIDRIDLG
jgi:hypothetical protein